MPCGIAYCKIHGNNPDYIIQASKKRRYKKVFLLDQLPIFEKDHVRTEDYNLALKIHDFIYQAYVDLGYNVVKVPVLSVNKRAEFVLDKIY